MAPSDSSVSDAAQRLSTIRAQIEDVDHRLLALFNERAALSQEVGRLKAHDPGIIFKPLREREVLDRLARENAGPLPDEHLFSIWREILPEPCNDRSTWPILAPKAPSPTLPAWNTWGIRLPSIPATI